MGEDSLAVGGTKEDKIRIGNSLWISDELSVNREYQTLAAQQFFAPTYVVDFHQEETGKKMGSGFPGRLKASFPRSFPRVRRRWRRLSIPCIFTEAGVMRSRKA